MIPFLLLLASATPADFGAVCDGLHDDGPALQAAFDLADVLDFRGLDQCRSNQTLVCDKRIHVIGPGPYRFAYGPSGFYIRFAAATDGLLVLPGCKHSIIEGIALAGTKTHVSDAAGILLKTSVTFRNIVVNDFDGHGILAQCGDTDPYGRNTNCNLARLDGVTLETNGGWGMWISGGDANTWLVDWMHCKDNELGCLYTKSFLGSYYNYFHSEGSPTAYGIYVDNPNARNVFSFVYIENPSPMHVPSPSVILGGHSSDGTPNSSWIEGGVHFGMWSFYNDIDFARSNHLNLGNAAGPGCALRYEQVRPGLDGNPRSAPFSVCNQGQEVSFNVGVQKALAIGDLESPYGHGSVAVAAPLHLGVYPNSRTFFWSDGLPTAACSAGDLRANSGVSGTDRCALFACDRGTWKCTSRFE